MTAHFVYKVAREWWQASGERTQERLASLVGHYAEVYALPASERAAALELARKESNGR